MTIEEIWAGIEARRTHFLETVVTVPHVAKRCHEANRAWAVRKGENPGVAWEDLSESQREETINGVWFYLEHPDAAPGAYADRHNPYSFVAPKPSLAQRKQDVFLHLLAKTKAPLIYHGQRILLHIEQGLL